MGYYSENYNQTVKDVLGELDKALRSSGSRNC